jgi:hypothetical protein
MLCEQFLFLYISMLPVIRNLQSAYNVTCVNGASGVILTLQTAYNAGHTMSAPQLLMQTTYAELLERCAAAAFADAFPEDGTFTPKTIRGRTYWYFQAGTAEGRAQRYVGPETPELLERIAHHKQARNDERERRVLVSTLVRSFGLARPIPEIGNIIAALAQAGVFRLRGVLVGTAAYQTYSAMLGVKLPIAVLQTGDVDIAQYKNVSVAIGDSTPPVLDTLKEVDKTFRSVPHSIDGRRITSYLASGGLRVDFLTPNEGPETEEPQALPALQTDAQPFRFLDYLIHDPEAAVILHDAGVYVHVPAPERYAVHKVIISRRRREGLAKRDKDAQQAEALFKVLVEKRPHELRLAWEEAYGRGKTWRQLLLEGISGFAPRSRDLVLKAVNLSRGALPGLDLSFNNPPARYDPDRDVVVFTGNTLGRSVECAINREALDDHFGASGRSAGERVKTFLENRSKIEGLARVKYLFWPIDEIGKVLVRAKDVSALETDALRSPPQRPTKLGA